MTQLVQLALVRAAEILANFESAEPASDATELQRLERKLEEWQACYAFLFKQMTDLVESSTKRMPVPDTISTEGEKS